MDWASMLYGIIDTAIYCFVGILLMGIGILLVVLFTPFSVKKEIEDDQNIALGLIMGAIIIAIAIIVSGVVSSPTSSYKKAVEQKTVEKAE